MPRNTPNDRFDSLPRSIDRVGAHRSPRKKGRGWVAFAWAAGVTAVLVGIGAAVIFTQSTRLDIALPGVTPVASSAAAAIPTAKPVPTPEPTVDPNLSITVLNGTPGAGIAAGVGELLTAAGWNVGATSNADTEDIVTTTIYYSDASLEGAARGIAASLPGAEIRLANDFAESGADLTVVVGNDYIAATE
ncbi:LytR C-terminal domain-containing protein [Glaciibacter psychrotolerans]|uniref:LytR/CpsA/Psr regulator C-terminal domain-containing protein n=1 Tax=Glaciibacter psychrotolerans TaxID=670054 RepID=A0A7Z0J4W1_9MICO|nr:LytR C-terminal domain-containing protein [Leifsonia psychrotolerans]NYJ18248.1 hypothetical protein [Leifsonia psychrotolerans]